MYQCTDCGHTFDEPQFMRERERIDYGVGLRWAVIWEGNACPECESAEFKEVSEQEET